MGDYYIRRNFIKIQVLTFHHNISIRRDPEYSIASAPPTGMTSSLGIIVTRKVSTSYITESSPQFLVLTVNPAAPDPETLERHHYSCTRAV